LGEGLSIGVNEWSFMTMKNENEGTMKGGKVCLDLPSSLPVLMKK